MNETPKLETVQPETVQPKDSLNSLETLTKSKRGGRRAGAGRPAKRFSVRSRVYDGESYGRTHYHEWRWTYIYDHAHPLINALSSMEDRSRDARGVYGYIEAAISPPFLSQHKALQLCHGSYSVSNWLYSNRLFDCSKHEHCLRELHVDTSCSFRLVPPEAQLYALVTRYRTVLERFVKQSIEDPTPFDEIMAGGVSDGGEALRKFVNLANALLERGVA